MPVWRHNVDLFTNFFGNGVSKEKPKSCAFEVMLVRNEKKTNNFRPLSVVLSFEVGADALVATAATMWCMLASKHCWIPSDLHSFL